MSWVPAGSINLQNTLQMGSANGDIQITPHHPILCAGELLYHEDGTFECEHASVPPEDPRTQQCLNNTVALLLFQILCERVG